ncbi:hypothetical protein BK749_14640 [Bacillus thuringiensis serovar vazensis]|uniref:Uncharacterized protein n=1 Tax=Bacillus thuringiensis serovar vazensis TaxID=180867 RepID=A0A243CVP1_BACTU|nr:hypothetical protein BK749_15995 [Bacillus thuringiensis serovar vazensis]OTY74276.1 hypothetical protein BK749_15920 [Bacillus thuringiensis serovar vazensis]OTY74984.1 hypothetical protein BK749_14675 [Bacillus thuringiensis serovar vazensis]OTY74998.1 hypothetical protein BK749_14640 [Bacillus thuringiensis serovar vazensis]
MNKMKHQRLCECKNCKRKYVENQLCQLLKRGDRILVRSFGERLQKAGIYLLMKDNFLLWFDEKYELNHTSLQGIHIERLR